MAHETARAALLVALFAFAGGASAETPSIHVEKSPSCGCCIAWVEHLDENGFDVTTRNLSNGALAQSKIEKGVTPELTSCHTAMVEGYVIEGHVPASDIARLLAERPDAIGLSVPGMPIGSPGMEYGDERDPYDVLLIRRDGSTEVFNSYR